MVTWNGLGDKFSNWQDLVAAQYLGSKVVVNGLSTSPEETGPINLSNKVLVGSDLWVRGSSGAPPITLSRTVIASTSRILTLGTHTEGNVIQANGTNWNFGVISLYLYPPGGHNPDPDQGNDKVFIARDLAHPNDAPNLVNFGTIASANGAVSRIEASVPDARLTNNGVIQPGRLTIDADVVGQGTIKFAAPFRNYAPQSAPDFIYSSIEFDRHVGAGQTIDMTNDARVILKDPQDFHAIIKGFTGPTAFGQPTPGTPLTTQDRLDFLGLSLTSTSYAGDTAHGTLTVKAGNAVAGNIRFAGDYTHAQFTITHDGQGNSQVLLS